MDAVPAETKPWGGVAGNLVLLLGTPRSGTTWLGKIFDSHPDVVYRHEPDTVLRARDLPPFCTDRDATVHRRAAREYVEQLAGVRTLKSAGSLPVFPKAYQSSTATVSRNAAILALRAIGQVAPLRDWAREAAIPDLVDKAAEQIPTMVMKSVSACGRVRLFADAVPEARIILILRHPCGQVASMMRGISLGKFESGVPVDEILGLPQAARVGLTAERLNALSKPEQHAWHWAILNQKAMDDLPRGARAKIIRYEDLGNAPLAVARELLAFAGLPWDPQVERFIERSTRSGGIEGYYQITKDPIAAMNKWRQELPEEDQRRILAIADETEVGRLFTRAA